MTQAPPPGFGRVRAGVTLMFLANGAAVGAWASSIPRVKQELALSGTALGSGLLSVALGAMLAMPLAGWLGARGMPHLLTATGVLLTLALPWPGLAGSLPVLAVALLVLGMGAGSMDVCMNARATVVENLGGRAIMSSFHAAFSLGGLVGAGVAAAAGWAGAGVFAGLLAAAVLLAGLVAGHAVLDPHAPTPQAKPGGAAWPGGALLMIGALCLLAFMAEGAAVDWSGVFLGQVAGFSSTAATAGFACFSAAMIAGRLGGDWIVRKLGPAAVLSWGALLAASGFLLAAALPWAGVAGFGLVGLGAANLAPVLFSAAGRKGGDASTGVAAAATLGYAGLLLGPPLVGVIADAAGLRWAMVVLAACAGAVMLGRRQLRR